MSASIKLASLYSCCENPVSGMNHLTRSNPNTQHSALGAVCRDVVKMGYNIKAPSTAAQDETHGISHLSPARPVISLA